MSDQKPCDKYIQSLEVRNFQLHENSVVNFCPGLNVLTGGNGRGKSGLLRALQLLIYNRPMRGVDAHLIRWKKKSLFIKATMNDGSWVIREKGKDINRYTVFDPVKYPNPLKLDNFGTAVPEEVSEVVGMRSVSFSEKSDKKDVMLNLSPQGEGFFMLGETNPEIARWMYSITNLHEIRGAMDQAQKDIKSMDSDSKSTSVRIEEMENKASKFPDLEAMAICLSAADGLKADLVKEMESVSNMSVLLNDMLELKEKAIPIIEQIESLQSLIDNISDETVSEISSFIAETSSMIEIDEKISKDEETITDLTAKNRNIVPITRIVIDDHVKDISNVLSLIEILSDNESIFKRMSEVSEECSDLEKEIEKADDEMKTIEKEIFGEGEKRCPLCGQDVGENAISHILSEE